MAAARTYMCVCQGLKMNGCVVWSESSSVQTIISMSVGSTCRLHASLALNLLPCISSHGIGGPGKLRNKTGCIICSHQSDIL